MEITGKIIKKFKPLSGTAKSGKPWRRQEYLLETDERHPKQIFFSLTGEYIDRYPMNIGDNVTISVDISSREYKERYYTEITAWKADIHSSMSQPASKATSQNLLDKANSGTYIPEFPG